MTVGAAPYGAVFDGTYVWFTTGPYLVQVRPTDGKILQLFRTSGMSAGIAFDGANLWIAEYDGKTISKM